MNFTGFFIVLVEMEKLHLQCWLGGGLQQRFKLCKVYQMIPKATIVLMQLIGRLYYFA
jgi:hypothetical protein